MICGEQHSAIIRGRHRFSLELGGRASANRYPRRIEKRVPVRRAERELNRKDPPSSP
jgi:hypothetical protein